MAVPYKSAQQLCFALCADEALRDSLQGAMTQVCYQL